jgi:hypothetical protein
VKLLYVILPQGMGENDLDGILYPFNFNVEMPPYPKQCLCIGVEAHEAATAAANKVAGDLSLIKLTELTTEGASAAKEKRRQWWSVFEAALAARKDAQAALAECSECGGSGKRMTTFNYRAFWNEFEFSRIRPATDTRGLLIPNCILFQRADGDWDWMEGEPMADQWFEIVANILPGKDIAFVRYS